MFDFDKFSKIDECIEFFCKENSEAHCFSLKSKGKWQAYTRGEFWTEVEKYTSLFARSFSESSLILFIKSLDLSLLAAYIGTIKAGHYPAQISPFSSKVSESEYLRKINHILAITKAKGIFTDTNQVEKLSVIEDLQVFTPESKISHPLKKGNINSELALVQFSSGSTGLQKGVILSHKAIIAHMKYYSQTLQLSPYDKIISWLPLYHDMGLIACYLMPLMCGIPFMEMDPFDWLLAPDSLLQTIEEQKATICFLPNFAYHVLINKGKGHDLSSVKLFINCSEPARLETHIRFGQKFPRLNPDSLTVCYALAENTFAVSQYLPAKKYGTKIIHDKNVISCGDVIEGTEVRIFARDSEGVGEVGIRGEYLFHSFIDGSLPFINGFYLTGDLGILTDENELFITGRKKDIVIINGKNIYPQDVEHAISNLAGVYPGRVVAFGILNETIGSEELFVIAEKDGSVNNNELKLAVQKAVEAEINIIPKRVEIVEHMSLVKTSSGKISRSRNKELYQNGELKGL